MIYDPDLTQLNFKDKPLTRSNYLNSILMGKSGTSRWSSLYENGILHIYIDDMTKPYMSTIINIGDMIDVDRFNKTLDGQQAGHAFISFSASTANSKRTTISSSVNSNIVLQLRNNTVTRDDANSTSYFDIISKSSYDINSTTYVTETNDEGTRIYYQIGKDGRVKILNGTVTVSRYGDEKITINAGEANLDDINLLMDEKMSNNSWWKN